MATKHERKDEVISRRIRPRLSTDRSLSMQHNVSKILKHLFVGSNDCVHDKSALESMEITHILNCTTDTRNYFENTDSIEYLRIPINDNAETDIQPHFEPAIAFIDDAKQKNGVCLVHCSHGMSRSVAFVLVYLMARQGMSLREALGFTRTRRPVASPNTGFMRLLVEEEKKTKESVSIDLEKYRENRFEEIENLAPK